MTPEKLQSLLSATWSRVRSPDTMCPALSGFNFVMKHALGGGATMSLRLDTLGKSMGSAVMRMKIHVEDGEL